MINSNPNKISKDVVAKALSQMNASQQQASDVSQAKGTDTEQPTTKGRKPRFKRVEHVYPVEPRVVQVVKKPKTFMDHTYRDFSQVPPEQGYAPPASIDDMSFAQKVHHMLSNEELSNWIHWCPHGRAFKIAVPKRLEQSKTLLTYFGHNRFSSFLRQLNNHGFKHLTKGTDRNCYYHECMLRGLPHLTVYMPPGRDARRQIPDPDNEPDFYQIDRLFPMRDAKQAVARPQQSLQEHQQRIPQVAQQQQMQQQNFPSLNQLPNTIPNMTQLSSNLLLNRQGGLPIRSPQAFGLNPDPMRYASLLSQPSPALGAPALGNSAVSQLNDPNVLALLLDQQKQQQQQQQQNAQSLFRFMP